MVSKRSSGACSLVRTEQTLRECAYTYQIRLPETLAGTEELVACGSADNEILGEIDTANAVKAADERLPRCWVDTCQHGADEVGTKALFVKR